MTHKSIYLALILTLVFSLLMGCSKSNERNRIYPISKNKNKVIPLPNNPVPLYNYNTGCLKYDVKNLVQVEDIKNKIIKSGDYAKDIFTYPEIYCQLIDERTGFYAAHFAVKHHKEAAIEALKYPSIYQLKTKQTRLLDKHQGYTVAHIAAIYHEEAALQALNESKIYTLTVGSNNWLTVAHVAVLFHKKAGEMALKNPEIYGLFYFPLAKDIYKMISASVKKLQIEEMKQVPFIFSVGHLAVLHKDVASLALNDHNIQNSEDPSDALIRYISTMVISYEINIECFRCEIFPYKETEPRGSFGSVLPLEDKETEPRGSFGSVLPLEDKETEPLPFDIDANYPPHSPSNIFSPPPPPPPPPIPIPILIPLHLP